MTPATALPKPIPEFQDIDQQIITDEAPPQIGLPVVLFVGDLLSDARKMSQAIFRLGGRIYPFDDFPCVPNGVVRSCELTLLKHAMRGVHKSQVDPNTLPVWTQNFRIPKGLWDVELGQWVDLRCGYKGTDTEDLVYRKMSPWNQIVGVLRGGGHNSQVAGCGVVQVSAGIEKPTDIREAQLHYFPNWLNILRGVESLPTRTLRQLEDHIRERQAKTMSPNMRLVGDAYLLSASQYREWGVAYTAYQSAAIKETEKFPGAVRYDFIAERLFDFLELDRKDDLVKNLARDRNDQSSGLAAMAEAVTKLAEAQQAGGNSATVIALLTQLVAEAKGIEIPPTATAPAPVSLEEAKAEFERATEDVIEENAFHDMSVGPIGDDVVDSFLEAADVDDEEDDDLRQQIAAVNEEAAAAQTADPAAAIVEDEEKGDETIN